MNSVTTMAQVVGMMLRDVPDTLVVLGPIISCPRHRCEQLCSQIRRCEQKREGRREHEQHDPTRPTTQLPHVPYTTPYAWEVHWRAPQSWVTSPLFTPLFTLMAGPSQRHARSWLPCGSADDPEGPRPTVGKRGTRPLRLSQRRGAERPALCRR